MGFAELLEKALKFKEVDDPAQGSVSSACCQGERALMVPLVGGDLLRAENACEN